jgi:hypothetical protein
VIAISWNSEATWMTPKAELLLEPGNRDRS